MCRFYGVALLIMLSFSIALRAQTLDLLLGHFEFHIDYTPVAGNANAGWSFSVSFDEDSDFNDATGITRIPPENVRLVASPGARQISSGATSRLAPEGEPLWLLPQENVPGTLFFGLRTVIPSGLFQTSINGFYTPSALGSIVLDMTAASGSGPSGGGRFGVWESRSLGSLEWHFDSSNGIGADDRLEPVPVGSHTHYNWGLSRPGSYRVGIRATGRLNPWSTNGNQTTSGSTTLTFVVPFSGVITGEAQLRLSNGQPRPAALYHSLEACEYATDAVALVTRSGVFQSTPLPYSFQLDATANLPEAPNRVGIPQATVLGLAPGMTVSSLEVLDVKGPGSLSLSPLDADSFLLSFSDPGIYRLTLAALLRNTASGELARGPAFTLTVLAGLPVDYPYTAYADSFERQHRKPAGSLSDTRGDADADGIANGLEFLLFWHGFDPFVSDAKRLPKPTLENGQWGITFIRDTYKDDFRLRALSLRSAFSSNLTQWTAWHTRTDSNPVLGVFETRSDNGTESLGYIMERRLLTRSPAQPGFFQFELF